MDEYPPPSLSQMIEGMVFQDVVPQGNESGSARIHHKRADFFQEPLHQQIELPLVNASFSEEIETGWPRSDSFPRLPSLAAPCESMFFRFHYRLILSFASSLLFITVL